MFNKSFYFILLTILTILLNFTSKEILDLDNLIFNSLTKQLTSKQVNEVINFQEKWQWLGNLILALLFLIKISIIAAILDVGCFFVKKLNSTNHYLVSINT